jgi:hypothetical protein
LLLAPKVLCIAMVGTQTQTYDDVPQHGSLSLHTKLEGASIAYAFLFPMVWPLDGFQGPVDYPNHGLWVVCKVILMIECSCKMHGKNISVI